MLARSAGLARRAHLLTSSGTSRAIGSTRMSRHPREDSDAASTQDGNDRRASLEQQDPIYGQRAGWRERMVEDAAYLAERTARLAAAEEEARAAGLEWRVKAAAIVSRRPVVLPATEPWRERYAGLKEEYATMLGQRVDYPKGFWNLSGGDDGTGEGGGNKGGDGVAAAAKPAEAEESEDKKGADAEDSESSSAFHATNKESDRGNMDGDDDLDLLGSASDLGDLDIDFVADENKRDQGTSAASSSASSSEKKVVADVSADTFRGFMFADRETEADRENDRTSLDRALDRHLFLVIKDGSTGGRWAFPSGVVGDSADERRKAARAEKGKEPIAPGDVLRDMADRKVREQVGAEVHLSMNMQGSGVPVGVHWEKASAAAAADYFGEKTFFFKAHVHARAGEPSPQVQLRSRKNGKKGKFMWLTREECAALFRKQEAVLAKKSGGTDAATGEDGVQLSALVKRLLH